MAGVFVEERIASQGNAKAGLALTSFHQPDATYLCLPALNVNPNLIDASGSLLTKREQSLYINSDQVGVNPAILHISREF